MKITGTCSKCNKEFGFEWNTIEELECIYDIMGVMTSIEIEGGCACSIIKELFENTINKEAE